MGSCVLCGARSPLIASALGLCLACIRRDGERALAVSDEVHRQTRAALGQAPEPPRTAGGAPCRICARECRIGDGERGYCGLREARDGRLVHLAGTGRHGLLQWYRDGLPTNCCADFFCPGHERHGDHNLAVFYGACSLNCLFCQNASFRRMIPGSGDDDWSADGLAAVANRRTFCVCYFGGDPSAQLPHALATSRRLAERGVAICWETNGHGNVDLMRAACRLARRTGGVVKFDLKALDPALYRVLTGSDNGRLLDNFRQAAEVLTGTADTPQLCAATLLVPGYVETQEVGRIALFISEIDPRIPYSLLAFHPQFAMDDLPATSRQHAEAALEAATRAGLRRVHLGNLHLLHDGYDVIG